MRKFKHITMGSIIDRPGIEILLRIVFATLVILGSAIIGFNMRPDSVGVGITFILFGLGFSLMHFVIMQGLLGDIFFGDRRIWPIQFRDWYCAKLTEPFYVGVSSWVDVIGWFGEQAIKDYRITNSGYIFIKDKDEAALFALCWADQALES